MQLSFEADSANELLKKLEPYEKLEPESEYYMHVSVRLMCKLLRREVLGL